MQVHVFPGRELIVHAGVLKDDAETLPHLVLMGGGVQTVDLDSAAGRLQQRGQHLDRGGFARPVGAEEGEDFALRHVE